MAFSHPSFSSKVSTGRLWNALPNGHNPLMEAHGNVLLLLIQVSSSYSYQISPPGNILRSLAALSLPWPSVTGDLCCLSTRSSLLRRVKSHMTGTLTFQHKCLYHCKKSCYHINFLCAEEAAFTRFNIKNSFLYDLFIQKQQQQQKKPP